MAQLAEEWGVTVHGYPITYDNFKKIRKSSNESYKYIVEAVKDHISDNYLKVRCLLEGSVYTIFQYAFAFCVNNFFDFFISG